MPFFCAQADVFVLFWFSFPSDLDKFEKDFAILFEVNNFCQLLIIESVLTWSPITLSP